jgi:hypothetical protein
MRAAKRSEDIRAVQRESMQVTAELRKVLNALHLLESPSPVQGGFSKQPPAWKGLREEPPSPSGGRSGWAIPPRGFRTFAYALVMLRIGAT